MEPFGYTRSSVQPDHALITPDTHVRSPLIDWKNASAVVHISPELGAGFTQYSACLEADAKGIRPPVGTQRFVFVREGQIEAIFADNSVRLLREGGYAWFSPETHHELRATTPANILVIEKEYQPCQSDRLPQKVVGEEREVEAEPFLGDSQAMLKTLLPIEPAFDMAVNIFAFQPGATLPQVEIHVMEHGLFMLDGAGVYRLADRWYPVRAGDVIWMAAYCPQWFVATGKSPARYIYYKDVHRRPHS